MKFYRPLPLDEALNLNLKDILVSKTDKNGKILYVNDSFCSVSGYTPNEVIGAPHNIIRHPDMPRAIFYLMWQTIQGGQNITVIVKNLAKTGHYYWVTTDFEIHKNSGGEIESFIAFRRPASKKAIQAIEVLYSTLLKIEKQHGMESSLVYLKGYLEERHLTYHEFMEGIVKPKSLMERLFSVMKKRFLHSDNNTGYSSEHREAV